MNRGGRCSLDKYLETKTNSKIKEKEAAIIIKQLATCLLFLHERGISHRDIKLGNVLIGEKRRVQLIDFGFATDLGDQRLKTFCGTPSYMCPEILKKRPYLGREADVWALGVLLYRLVTGTQPFNGKGKDLKKNIVKGRYKEPMNVSETLYDLLEGMICMDPNNRLLMDEVRSILIKRF